MKKIKLKNLLNESVKNDFHMKWHGSEYLHITIPKYDDFVALIIPKKEGFEGVEQRNNT